MSPGVSLLEIARAGMIVLALAASLPQVVCCCDVSWGPGGLLGSKALCQTQRSSNTTCCCCEAKQDESPSQDEPACSESGCECHFSIVAPSPISTSRGVDLDHAESLDVDLLPGSVMPELQLSTCLLLAAEGPASPLTSPGRCALLQTWRI